MSSTKIEKGGFHQIQATINVPTDPELLRKVFTGDQLRKIADNIGDPELVRLSQDNDHHSQNEAKNLRTVRQAIHAVTGHEAPWIIGFASEFGAGLRTALKDS